MSSRADQLSDARALEEAAQWCIRLSGGELSEAERIELEAWLTAEPRNRELLDDAMRAWNAVEEQASQPHLLEMRSTALDDVRRAQNRLRARKSLQPYTLWAVAASVLLSVAIGFGWSHYASDVYRTREGERRVVQLADGSSVSMDAATVLKVRYSEGGRRLYLDSGRAKFSVSFDPLRPFSVSAGETLVVATGTQFSVERLVEEVRVILYEGRVAVFEAAGSSTDTLRPLQINGASGEAVLTPGHELIAPSQTGTASIVTDEPQTSLSWESGQLVFSNEQLGTAIERMNRYSKSKMRVGDADAGRVRISGVFATGDTRAFVDGVTTLFPVKARTVDDELTLVTDPHR